MIMWVQRPDSDNLSSLIDDHMVLLVASTIGVLAWFLGNVSSLEWSTGLSLLNAHLAGDNILAWDVSGLEWIVLVSLAVGVQFSGVDLARVVVLARVGAAAEVGVFDITPVCGCGGLCSCE
jgi:hypothetical protein